MSIILPKLQQNLWEGARMMRRTLEDQTPNMVQQGCSSCGGQIHDPNSGHQPVYSSVHPAYPPINMGPAQDALQSTRPALLLSAPLVPTSPFLAQQAAFPALPPYAFRANMPSSTPLPTLSSWPILPSAFNAFR